MSTTQLRLDTQAKDATLIPSKISTNPTDDFSFPRDVSAGRDLKITQGNKLYLNGTSNISQTDGSNVEFNSTSAFSFHINSVYSWQITDTDASGGVGTAPGDWTMYLPRGTAAQPVVFIGDSAGLFTPDGNALSVSTQGSEVARFNTTGLTMSSSKVILIDDGSEPTPSIAFTATPGTGLFYVPFGSENDGLGWSTGGSHIGTLASDGIRLLNGTYLAIRAPGSSGSGAIYMGASENSYIWGTDTQIGFAPNNTDVAHFESDGFHITAAKTIFNADGTAAVPSYSFTGDTDTGVFHISPNKLGFATNGTQAVLITSVQDVNLSQNLNILSDKKLFLGNAGNAWVKYSTGTGTFLTQSETGGEGAAQFASPGELDFYSNTSLLGVEGAGTYSPGIEMYATGNIWMRNDGTLQGIDGDRYVQIRFDQGNSANGFNSVVRLNRGNNDNFDYLELGYDDNGAIRTGSRIRGTNLTIQSLSPLNFIADTHIFTGQINGDTSDQTKAAYRTGNVAGTGITGGVLGSNSIDFLHDGAGVASMNGTDFDISSGNLGFYGSFFGIADSAATVGVGLFGDYSDFVGFASGGNEIARVNTTGMKLIPGKQITFDTAGYNWIKWSSDHNGLLINSGYAPGQETATNLNAQGEFTLNANTGLTGSGSYLPFIGLRTGGEIDFLIDGTASSPWFSFQVNPGNIEKVRIDTTGLQVAQVDDTPSIHFDTHPDQGIGIATSDTGNVAFYFGGGNRMTLDGYGVHFLGINATTIGSSIGEGFSVVADLGGSGSPALTLTPGNSPFAVDFYSNKAEILFNDVSSEIQFNTGVSYTNTLKIAVTGLVMQGASTIDMGGNKIINLAAATANGDATRFEQTVLTDGSHPITGDQSFSSTAKITNLVDPLNAQDGATKAYVDAAIAGLSWKEAAQAASTANVTIASAPATLDGYTLVADDRILLKDQTSAAENGIYKFNGTGNPLTRTTDADSWTEIVGLVIYIEEGTTNTGSKWVNTNVPGGTIGVTAITFTTFAAASAIDGVGTAGYNAYWTAAHTLAAEQYVAASRGGLATDASAFTGVVKASGGTFSASTIVNADVNASAAIAESKLALDFSTSSLNTAIGTKVSKAGDTMTGTLNTQSLIPTANTAYDLGQATPFRWRDIYLNGQVKGGGSRPNGGSASLVALGAQGTDDTGLYFTGGTLHYSKAGSDQGELATLTTSLSPALTSAHIFVGNASNVATDTAMSGDITINNTGVTAIGAFKVTPGKISNVATDDFTFPRNVTVTSQLNLNTGNKISFDNGGQVYLQSNAGDNILIGHSATTGVNVFSLGSFGQIDLITQAQGAGFPKLSMSPDGTRGSVLWTTSGAGSVGSRYMGIQFDDDVTNAFHSIERFARTSIASPYLEFGYDANGSIVTGSRIRGSNLTVESLSPLNLVATRVNAVGADFAVDTNKKVILGNSDNAWWKFSSAHNAILGNTVSGNHLYIAAANDLRLYANSATDGSGDFVPEFDMFANGFISLVTNLGTVNSYISLETYSGVTAGFHQGTLFDFDGKSVKIGYDADGSSETGTRIQGDNLTIESLSPLNLVGSTVQINGKVEIFTSGLPYSTIRSYPDAQTDLNGYFQFGPEDGDNNWISAKNNGGEIEAFAILSYAGSGSFNPRIQFFADGTNGDIRMNSTEGGFRFTTSNDPVLDLSSGSGKITAHQVIYGLNGTAGAPAYSFSSNTNAGMYMVSSNLFFSTGGTTQLGIVNAGQIQVRDGSVGAPTYSFFNDTDTGFTRINNNAIEIVLGGTSGFTFNKELATSNYQLFANVPGIVTRPVFSTSGSSTTGIFFPSGNVGITKSGVEIARFTSSSLAMQGSSTIDMGTNKITNMGDPTSAQDAATKFYVDSLSSGLILKDAVRVATTAALPAYTAAGSGVGKTLTANAVGILTVDGVATVLNDRILVKDQGVSHVDHGIYTVTTQGTAGVAFVLTRSTDFDGTPAGEVKAGDFTFVTEGSMWQDTGWVLSTNNPITLDTTAIKFTQFSSAGVIVAGAGLLQTGNTFDVVSADDSLTINADSLQVRRDGAGAVGLTVSGIKLNVDNSSIEINSNAIRVKAAGITYAMSNVVTRETPSGTVDGSNAVFTLASSAAVGSEMVFLNGILQDVGGANDYTISSGTITFTSAPLTGSKIRVTYWKA